MAPACCMSHGGKPLLLLLASCVLVALLTAAQDESTPQQQQPNNGHLDNPRQQQQQPKRPAAELARQRDLRWPNRQLNVLVDLRSLNQSERSVISTLFDQIEHKTCVRVNRLPAESLNPFDTRQLNESERNFIYIFKSEIGQSNRHPSLGLSSLGCVRQGRQSLVLTDLAFRWPELVLRYHVLRSLGIESIERPDGQVRRLLNWLPLSQKISYEEAAVNGAGGAKQASEPLAFDPNIRPGYFAYAAAPPADPQHQGTVGQQPSQLVVPPPTYLSQQDLEKIKELYSCPDYQNRLSPPIGRPPPMADASDGGDAMSKQSPPNLYSGPQLESNRLLNEQLKLLAPSSPLDAGSKQATTQKKLESAEHSIQEIINAVEADRQQKINDSLIDDAAKSIVDYLLAESADETQAATVETKASPKPATTTAAESSTSNLDPSTSGSQEQPTPPIDSLFPESMGSNGTCNALESCPLPGLQQQQQQQERQERSSSSQTPAAEASSSQERPMLLKLDQFHAQDPHLQQANQMKLSQLNDGNLQTYRLMTGNDHDPSLSIWPNQQQQQQQQQRQPDFGSSANQMTLPGGGGGQSQPKSEMLISFEQTNPQAANPIAALAGSQVLKLCSCTCQTMTPSGGGGSPSPPEPPTTGPFPPTTFPTGPAQPSSPQPTYEPPPNTQWPPYSPYPTNPSPTNVPGNNNGTTKSDDDGLPPFPPATLFPPSKPTSDGPQPNASTPVYPTLEPPFTIEPPDSTTPKPPPSTSKPTTEPPQTPTGPKTTKGDDGNESTIPGPSPTPTAPPPPGHNGTMQPLPPVIDGGSPCDQVQWVRPNKTVYASAKIVWDVDRANQNYFLCNNIVNSELVPGKTHGFACHVGSEGKEYELHNFSVLIKPERVNLAWVQRSSSSFGKGTETPVIGGVSKTGDPYVVSRCLVRDENNDVITLIGYVPNSSQGVGWFPHDGVQIECNQYDVLACMG